MAFFGTFLMDPNQNIEENDYSVEMADEEEAEVSVDDFIRQLEAKEKDLHITAETTFIEIAADFENDEEVPDFLKKDLKPGATVAVKPAAAPAVDRAEVAKLEAEIVELRKKMAALQEERTELYKNSQRRLKDFEAFKARTERERSETFQRQLSNLATQMLPALDNLDRALQFASEMPEEKQGGFTQFFDGIVLVNQQVNEVLVGMGIDPIQTVGFPFDPHYHEAVAIDEDSALPPNTITAELLRGFRIGENVIRHAMVRVSKAAAAENPSPESEEDHGGADDIPELDRHEADPDTTAFDADNGFDAPDKPESEKGFEVERNGE